MALEIECYTYAYAISLYPASCRGGESGPSTAWRGTVWQGTVCLTQSALAQNSADGTAASDSDTENAPLRIEVPLEAPDAESQARRSAYKGCYDWATALLESQRQVDSDRGLGSLLGSDYQEFHSPASNQSNSFELRRVRMVERCMRERQAEQENP